MSRVARYDEHSILDSHFNGSKNARAVIVVGDEGVGKTHLVEGFATDLETSGAAIVLRAETTVGFAPQLFAPLIDLVQDNWDQIERAGAGNEAAELAAAARRRLKAREILHRFDVFVGKLCQAKPVVLVADHVSEAHEAVLDAFAHAHRRNRDRDLCILVSARPDDKVAMEFLERTDALVLPLDPLTVEESQALVAQIAGDTADLDPEEVDDIVAQGSGNPLLLRELTIARMSGSAGGTTVRLLLTAKLDRLSPSARSILEAAALGVRPLSYRFCALLTGVDPETPVPLHELRDAGLLTERDGRLVFPNPVVPELVAGTLTQAARRDTHRRMAGLLRLLGARADEVAHHALAGSSIGDPYAPVAIKSALEAAEELLSRGFPIAALAMVDRGLQLEPEPALENSLLTIKGEALLSIGDTTEAARVFETVLAKRGDGKARIGLARSLQRAGRLTTALKLFEQSSGPEADRGRAEVLLGLGRTSEAWELAGRELERARASGDVAALASALADAALVQAVRMEPGAVELATAALDAWERAGEDSLDWPPLFACGVAYESADRFAESLTALRALRNWLDSRGLIDAVPRVVRTETVAAFLSLSWGRMEEAIAAAADVRRNRPNHEMAPIRAAAAALATLRGDEIGFVSAVNHARQALSRQATPFDRALTEWWLAISSFMRLELEEGVAAFERAAAGFRNIGASDLLARTLPTLAAASAALGRDDFAGELVAEYRELVKGRGRPSTEADLLVLETVSAPNPVERARRMVEAAELYRAGGHRFGMIHATMSAAIIDRAVVPAELLEECMRSCPYLGIDNAVYRLAVAD